MLQEGFREPALCFIEVLAQLFILIGQDVDGSVAVVPPCLRKCPSTH